MITSARMAAVDRNAEALGVPRRVLMESSGGAVARTVEEIVGPDDTIEIVAGRGNNGGDGFAAARFLDAVDVRVTLLGDPSGISTSISQANWNALESSAYDTRVIRDASAIDAIDGDVVVDAMLGTGITGTVREPVRTAIERINQSDATVVSVDVPSGLDPDGSGVSAIAVEADQVVTFHDRKPVHAELEMPVTVADIGIPPAAERFVGPGDLVTAMERSPEAHKGDHGRVLIVGGGPYVGAPALSAIAAYRAGADLVHLAVPETIADVVSGFHPEFIVHALPGDRLALAALEGVRDRLEQADVVVVGPGLGDDDGTMEAVRDVIERVRGRLVVDADALAVLPECELDADVVATPHAGEFANMGFDRPADWTNAETSVEAAAADLGSTVLLKGRYDVISDGNRTRVNRTGNPGMTVGGTGDVLTGVTAALLARFESFHAACMAAWTTGRAGDICAEEAPGGFLASDVADVVRPAMVVEE